MFLLFKYSPRFKQSSLNIIRSEPKFFYFEEVKKLLRSMASWLTKKVCWVHYIIFISCFLYSIRLLMITEGYTYIPRHNTYPLALNTENYVTNSTYQIIIKLMVILTGRLMFSDLELVRHHICNCPLGLFSRIRNLFLRYLEILRIPSKI